MCRWNDTSDEVGEVEVEDLAEGTRLGLIDAEERDELAGGGEG